MRAFACASAISLALTGAAGAAAPRRVASLNLCTDELLLLIAAPKQIASVSYLSQLPEETPLWPAARPYRRNDGSLLSVAGLKPDLVLTMGGSSGDRAGVARRLGAKLIILPYPAGIADVEASTMKVAAALGREARGRQLVEAMERIRRSPPRRPVDAIYLSGGGRSVAASGTAAEWMAAAGLRQRRLAGDRADLETLLVRPPAVLLRSSYRSGQFSAEQRWLSHPLARRVRAGRALATDGRLWTCMGPLMVPEVLRLRRALGR
ncbi:MAG: ABC transporter substrate-binding protein [Alphaproteobacteria bacterium]|nr:ABC transporter substrate-binding protein [Alphaproteobacteria bacterium]